MKFRSVKNPSQRVTQGPIPGRHWPREYTRRDILASTSSAVPQTSLSPIAFDGGSLPVALLPTGALEPSVSNWVTPLTAINAQPQPVVAEYTSPYASAPTQPQHLPFIASNDLHTHDNYIGDVDNYPERLLNSNGLRDFGHLGFPNSASHRPYRRSVASYNECTLLGSDCIRNGYGHGRQYFCASNYSGRSSLTMTHYV